LPAGGGACSHGDLLVSRTRSGYPVAGPINRRRAMGRAPPGSSTCEAGVMSAPLRFRFVQSASDHEQLPPARSEIAFVGRSNVGKSSLLNALAGQRGLAHVSKSPGRTQLLNLFSLDEHRSAMDLPGYGFAQVGGEVRA